MTNMWEALGATLLAGNQMAGQSRLEKRQEGLDAQNAEMQAVQKAILLGQQEDRILGQKRQRAVDAMSAGPNAMLDPEAAQAVKEGGFGSRLGPQFETLPGVDPLLGTPAEIQTMGQRILPTTAEQMQIDADGRSKELYSFQRSDLQANQISREKQTAIRAQIENPEFWKNSPEKRQLAWAQAGYSGQAPMQEREVRDRMQFEHNLEMQKVNAMGQNALAVANARKLGGGQAARLAMSLRKDLVAETKTATELNKQFTRMQAGAEAMLKGGGNLNPASQAILVTFQKILDDESVVRESEYARSAQGLALRDRIRGMIQRQADGGPGVPPERLQEFVSLAQQFVTEANASAAEKHQTFMAFAEDNGLDTRFIGGGMSFGEPALPGSLSPSTPTPAAAPGNASPAAPSGKFTITGVR